MVGFFIHKISSESIWNRKKSKVGIKCLGQINQQSQKAESNFCSCSIYERVTMWSERFFRLLEVFSKHFLIEMDLLI